MTNPIVELTALSAHAGHRNTFFGLLGSAFPTGSIKYVTVLGLLAHLQNTGKLSRIDNVYGSTSGNTGIAAAAICKAAGYQFVALVDHKLEEEKADRIVAHGGQLIRVAGGVQQRIAKADTLAKEDPYGVDLDQYTNPGALLGHYQISGPLIWRAMRGTVDAIIIAIGTGGTFGGISAFLTQHLPNLTTIAVDARGSAIIDGKPATRYLTGIGCAFIPQNARRAYQHIRSKPQVVCDQDAFTAARWLQENEHVGVGGSGGAVVYAAMQLATQISGKRIMLVFHDGAESYRSTVFSDEWMHSHNLITTINEVRHD